MPIFIPWCSVKVEEGQSQVSPASPDLNWVRFETDNINVFMLA